MNTLHTHDDSITTPHILRIAVTEFLMETTILLVVTKCIFVEFVVQGLYKKDMKKAVAKADSSIERYKIMPRQRFLR